MYLPEHPAEAGHRFVSTGSLPPGSGVDGTVRSVGDTATGFTLMSVSKPFVFALAVDAVGLARVPA